MPPLPPLVIHTRLISSVDGIEILKFLIVTVGLTPIGKTSVVHGGQRFLSIQAHGPSHRKAVWSFESSGH